MSARLLSVTDADGAVWSLRYTPDGEVFPPTGEPVRFAQVEFALGADVDDPEGAVGTLSAAVLLASGSMFRPGTAVTFPALRVAPVTMDKDTADLVRDWLRGRAYDQACDRAATSQGLDPVMRILDDAGMAYDLEQTGGFTMCVTFASPRIGGTYVIGGDVDLNGPSGTAMLAYFPGDTWHECGEPGEEWVVTADGLRAFAHALLIDRD